MRQLTLAALFAFTMSVSAVTPLWIRDAKISPDGKEIAFTYQGGIYLVSAEGGHAQRLTGDSSLDFAPVWSPDGKQIAFASDRNGGRDIYIMDRDGGNQTRLTYNSAYETPESFTPDGENILFSASIQDPVKSISAPMRPLTELYSVSADGGRISQVLATPAKAVTMFSDGSFLYEDVKGFEDTWRKHHKSSVTRDIWKYDKSTGRHRNLTAHAGEDLNPVISTDESTMYFLSEREGSSMNIYGMDLNSSAGNVKSYTQFKDHPVRFLSMGSNGKLAFTWNGELYTMLPGQSPAKVNIQITDKGNPEASEISFSSISEAVPSNDGKQIAFITRGEVFVKSTEYDSQRQITETPAGESGLSWGKDDRTLYYSSRRSGKPNIWKATIVRKDDPNFSNATSIKEEPLFADDGIERSEPLISPDGKKMAYIQNRTELKVMDLETKKIIDLDSKQITNYRSGGFDFSWSPDSRWIVLTVMNPSREPYTDIDIVNVDTKEFIPITVTGYFDQQPRFTPDGNAILFASERFGMRNHGSWGSQYDVMMAFLNRDAYDRFRLSPEDYELLKDVEKQQKKDSEKKNTADYGKGKKGKKNKKKSPAVEKKDSIKPVIIEKDGLEDRIIRLTPSSSDLSDFVISPDGETLFYLTSFEEGYDLWKKDLRKGDVSMVKKLNAGESRIHTDKEGNMYLIGKKVKRFDKKGGDMKDIKISGKMKMDRAAEREAMFDYMTTEARERFYLPVMSVDWDFYKDEYRRFLPHITDNQAFADMMSEMLGELNVSHSGGRYYGRGAKDMTASLGLLFDMENTNDGLIIEEILSGGPFDRATTKVKAGDIVKSINGKEITDDADWSILLNGITKHKTLISFNRPSTGETWEEVVLPISQGKISQLLYDRWIKNNARMVDSLSNGRLGYVHIQSMSDESFRKVYADVLGKYADKEGIVIDTRWNGGGRLHEDIEVLFSGEKYLTQEIHGKKSSEMPSRRWNKPSIMLICEANYSNAHGTPWVYKHKGLGKLVGMPVPGTMSSVNWIPLQDPELLFGVPVVAFRTEDGSILENQQLEPDIKIANRPEDVIQGIDSQITVAVTTLLKDIDSKKK